MPTPISLPEEQTSGYLILSLTAILGELPPSQLSRLPIGQSYKTTLVGNLKRDKLLRTFYRDGLRGYRLTHHAKDALCEENPERFSYALSRASTSNHLRGDVPRRLRMHRIAEVTISMLNAGVDFHRDRKPHLFAPQWPPGVRIPIFEPYFYNSREVKELGNDAMKVKGSRSAGMLLCPDAVYIVYNIGSCVIRWEYNEEMRLLTLMQTVLADNRLRGFRRDMVHGVIFADSMELLPQLMDPASPSQHFILEGGLPHIHLLTNNRFGEGLLRLLYDLRLREDFEDQVLGDYYAADPNFLVENDAITEASEPVLLGHTCDLPKIKRFDKGLDQYNRQGLLICFDFQKEALAQFCSHRVHFLTLDFQQWERSFICTKRNG